MTLPGPEATAAVHEENPRAQTGTRTLEALYREHFELVYRVVGRTLGPGASPADIEDLCQVTFLQAHRGLAAFRGECKPSTWLCGIAMRSTLQWLRGRGRRRRLIEALTLEPTPGATHTASPEAAAASRAELLQVWATLLRMKEGKRAVYVLHELEGLPGPEVARALGIPVGTVWTRLHHARKALLAVRLGAGVASAPEETET